MTVFNGRSCPERKKMIFHSFLSKNNKNHKNHKNLLSTGYHTGYDHLSRPIAESAVGEYREMVANLPHYVSHHPSLHCRFGIEESVPLQPGQGNPEAQGQLNQNHHPENHHNPVSELRTRPDDNDLSQGNYAPLIQVILYTFVIILLCVSSLPSIICLVRFPSRHEFPLVSVFV